MDGHQNKNRKPAGSKENVFKMERNRIQGINRVTKRLDEITDRASQKESTYFSSHREKGEPIKQSRENKASTVTTKIQQSHSPDRK